MDDDLRTFLALRAMRDEALDAGRQDAFEAWLRKKRPLLDTTLFKQAGLSPPPISLPPSPVGGSGDPYDSVHAPRREPVQIENAREVTNAQEVGSGAVTDAHSAGIPAYADAIPIGRRITLGEEPVGLPTKLLPRHTAIIAGSGSGKTVLLRRLVE